MATLLFSLGTDTFDNEPAQCSATDFDDFIRQISSTGSTKKGQYFICAPLAEGLHYDLEKRPWPSRWRIVDLALPRRFLALDVDRFSTPEDFDAFRRAIAPWNALVYTTASHTDEQPRARALIELSREVDCDEGVRLGEAVQHFLENALGADKLELDPSVYRAVQPVYVPLVSAQTFRYCGAPLDVDATLVTSTTPAPKRSRMSSANGAYGGTGTAAARAKAHPTLGIAPAHITVPATPLLVDTLPETPAEIARVTSALAKVSADCGYPAWIKVIFALRSLGWTCAEELARQWSMTASNRYEKHAFDKVWGHENKGTLTLF